MLKDFNRLLGAFGGGQKLQALGKEWTVSPPTLQTLGEYEAWMKMRASQEVIAAKDVLDAADYREMLAAVNADITCGVYNWGSDNFERIVKTVDGFRQLFYLMLKPAHSHITSDQADAILADNHQGVAEALKSIFPSVEDNGQASAESAHPKVEEAPTTVPS